MKTTAGIRQLCMRVESFWRHYSSIILLAALGLTLLSIVLRTFPELHRLLISTERGGAIDLRARYGEIPRWFSGLPVYTGRSHGGYPPASYVLLFPFFGWAGESATRWLWGAISLAELAILSCWAICLTHTRARLQKALIILTFFSAYPFTVTVGNGQLGIHVFTVFLGALRLFKSGTGQLVDLGTSILLLLAAVKPSFSAPLYWIFLFAAGRLRPIVIAGSGYVLLTAFALTFQSESLWQIVSSFHNVNAEVINRLGGVHIAVWMRALGLSRWTSAASLALFIALGIWIYRNRRADIWILLGVSAIVARVWTYHAMYDDLLVFFAMIALLRWLRKDGSADIFKVPAGCLLGAAWLAMFMPASTVNYPLPWSLPYELGLSLIWGSMLLLLIRIAHRGANAAGVQKPDAMNAVA